MLIPNGKLSCLFMLFALNMLYGKGERQDFSVIPPSIDKVFKRLILSPGMSDRSASSLTQCIGAHRRLCEYTILRKNAIQSGAKNLLAFYTWPVQYLVI